MGKAKVEETIDVMLNISLLIRGRARLRILMYLTLKPGLIYYLLHYLQGLGFYLPDTRDAPRNRQESIESLWSCSTVQGLQKIPLQTCSTGLQGMSTSFLPQDSLPFWSLVGNRKNSARLLFPPPYLLPPEDPEIKEDLRPGLPLSPLVPQAAQLCIFYFQRA